MNVVILFGGKSVEHDVSIITYLEVLKAIDTKKYHIIPIYLDKDNRFLTSKRMDEVNDFKDSSKRKFTEVTLIKKANKTYVKKGLNKIIIDVVIPCVHGKDLENGVVSGFLQLLGVPYTSSNISESVIFHNKYYTKLFLEKNKINTLNYVYVNKYKWLSNNTEILKQLDKMKKKIIKPVNLGSSIGINIANTAEETITFIDEAFKYDDEIIVENYLEEFQEFNQAAYITKNEIIISKIEEVSNTSPIYDFSSKYENKERTRKIPAKISGNLKNKITKTTKKIMEIFYNKGLIRIDYLYSAKDNQLYVNEINVIPGSLAYYLFEAKDVFFSKIIDDLIIEAIHTREIENNKIVSYTSTILDNCQNNKK